MIRPPAMRAIVAICGMLLMGACAHPRADGCDSDSADAVAVDRTVRAFFAALAADDLAAYARLTTPTFYSYDVGKRFDGIELAELVQSAHARGVQLNWTIGPVDAHVGCGMAWAAWENRGSAGVPPKVEPVVWLESAVLVKQGGEWKIDFFHSTRAAPVRPAG